MSWKNIKTFLIILFLIINAYLVFSTNGFTFHRKDTTYTDEKVLNDAISVISKNYNVILDAQIVPKSFKNPGNIDVTNIIYTKNFKSSDFDFKTNGAFFETEIKTNTFSYNEINSKDEIIKILENIGIEKSSYDLTIRKSDEGLVCYVKELIAPYPLFNGQIKAVFSPSRIKLTGSWYIMSEGEIKQNPGTGKLCDITTVIIDTASRCSTSDAQETITSIDFGYYVSSYDETAVSKSSSAIPCYLLETADGSKYYYDSLNGKPLKQEE